MRIGREQIRTVLDRLGGDPDVVGRDRLTSLTKAGEDLSETLRCRQCQRYDPDIGLTEELIEHPPVLLVSRAIVKSIQQLSQDHGRDHHFFCFADTLNNHLLRRSQRMQPGRLPAKHG